MSVKRTEVLLLHLETDEWKESGGYPWTFVVVTCRCLPYVEATNDFQKGPSGIPVHRYLTS